MASKLFVGGLPYAMTNEDLQKLFEEHGTVESAVIIFDRDTQRSKGFGFVEMATDEEAQAAIAALHEKEVQGRRIVVSPARPKEDRPAR